MNYRQPIPSPPLSLQERHLFVIKSVMYRWLSPGSKKGVKRFQLRYCLPFVPLAFPLSRPWIRSLCCAALFCLPSPHYPAQFFPTPLWILLFTLRSDLLVNEMFAAPLLSFFPPNLEKNFLDTTFPRISSPYLHRKATPSRHCVAPFSSSLGFPCLSKHPLNKFFLPQKLRPLESLSSP